MPRILARLQPEGEMFLLTFPFIEPTGRPCRSGPQVHRFSKTENERKCNEMKCFWSFFRDQNDGFRPASDLQVKLRFGGLFLCFKELAVSPLSFLRSLVRADPPFTSKSSVNLLSSPPRASM
jgi:hypothetical protein